MARIAAVQHGDYLEAMQMIGSGQVEPYSGMKNSLEVLARLFDGHPHLVISLNAPTYSRQSGDECMVGLPELPSRLMPGRVRALLRARAIVEQLRVFQPTHVLLRSGGVIAWRVLEYCRRCKINTLVLFANCLPDAQTLWDRWIERRLIQLLNEPNVFLVGNHRQPAAQQLIERGVSPIKVIAYDWPFTRTPAQYSPKIRTPKDSVGMAYVGSLTLEKGVLDLLEAVAKLATAGLKLHLTIAGDGPLMPVLRERVEKMPLGLIRILGRVSNDAAFDLMRASDLVCVPSWHEFTEGLPFTITEALTSRTPLIVSDHPMFVRAFIAGQGVKFFPAKDSERLASVLAQVIHDHDEYERLSNSTSEAFEKVRSQATFAEIIDRWASVTVREAEPVLHLFR